MWVLSHRTQAAAQQSRTNARGVVVFRAFNSMRDLLCISSVISDTGQKLLPLDGLLLCSEAAAMIVEQMATSSDLNFDNDALVPLDGHRKPNYEAQILIENHANLMRDCFV